MLNQLKRSLLRFQGRYRLLSFLIGACLVLGLSAIDTPLLAQTSVQQARIAEILNGNQVYIQNSPAQVNDVASRGQRVSTGDSRTQLAFNTGAIARLSQNSVLTVGQCAQLQQGVMLVNGAANGCTASVTAGVRGTTYLMEVNESGREQVTVLEGEVVVARRSGSDSEDDLQNIPVPPASDDSDSPEDTSDQITLAAGEEVEIREGGLGSVQRITQSDFIEILTGGLFDGFTDQLPGLGSIRETFQRMFPRIPFPLDAGGGSGHRPRLPF